MMTNSEIHAEFQQLIEDAYRISRDAGLIVEEALREAVKQPMTREEAMRLLTTVIDKLKSGASGRGDEVIVKSLDHEMDKIIQQAMQARERILQNVSATVQGKKILKLTNFNGREPGPVHPRPTFHRREIVMNCGGVKTTDIILWEGNERLDIHVSQFKATNGRIPSSSELLDIMLSKMPLQGLGGADQFKIIELARSIANNGVRKPPIIDLDGTLLDGNRRVAACYYILNSDEFDSEQKKRAENIFVWQLTEHATADDRQAVVVSLNFEPDCKQNWPEYVKAKIIYNEWQAMLAREPHPPGTAQLAEMKRELASQFGYGQDPYMVNRYIKMVNWGNDFEDYLVNQKHRDAFEVKHQANRYFQYFEELAKGTTAGGVAHTLNHDESFKHLVFDLLFQGKFKNWTLIRNLRYYNPDVVDAMIKALDMTDVETSQDIIEDKLNEAKAQQRESRIGNPNQRIEVFTRWLEQVPISAFRDVINKENLKRLLEALRLVERQIGELDLEDNQ